MIVSQSPESAPVSTTEYLQWRADAAAAHRARHALDCAGGSGAASPLALKDQQTVRHYAAALLRDRSVVEEVLGARGRVAPLKYYLVPSRWMVRTDAVFLPDDGGAATVIRIRAAEPRYDRSGTFVPGQADLFALAYERFTMRRAGTQAVRCLLIVLNPDHRSDPQALQLREMFEYHDVTRFIDERPTSGGATIRDVVAAEAELVTEYLQDRDPVADVRPVIPGAPPWLAHMLSSSGPTAVGRILGRIADE